MDAPVSRPDLSVVLPCYGASSLARRSVAELSTTLEESGLSWEVIVVDDGANDFVPHEWHDRAGVRTGMLAATGHARVFTDVDLPFGTDLFPAMHAFLRDGFHLVIGDRSLPGSTYHQATSWSRRAASALFTEFVGRIVTGGFFDTQCGLKGVRGDVADALFPLLRVDRFAFDVELVYVALKHRLDIKRIPVQLLHNETSSVRLARDAVRGAIDVFRIKANQIGGQYQSRALEAIVRSDFEAVARGARNPGVGIP